MVSVSDIKFYKSVNNGLGGGIDTSQLITSGNPNNLFPLVTKAESDAGSTRYLLAYIKNTSTETAKSVKFWHHSGGFSGDAVYHIAKGIAGKNGNEPAIANINTAPAGVITWITDGTLIDIGDLAENDRYGIWFKSVTAPDSDITRSATHVFRFKFTNPSGGTGSDPDPSGGGTGGSGGNPVPSTTDWKIGVVGDMDSKSVSDRVCDLLDGCNKWIGVGDYGYGNEDGWIDMANDHGLKSKMLGFAMGNHEEDDGYGAYTGWAGIGNACFMRKWENVAVITVDSNKSVDSGSSQNNSVRSFLTNANNDSNIDWIFCTMHHPWFGSGSDHGYNDIDQVQAFHDLFSDNTKFAFVFTGHNHNWQRTHKVRYNSSDPEDPIDTDTSSPFTNDGNGIIHVVSGGGGHDSGSGLYALDDDIGTDGNPNAYQNRSNNGIYEITASNNGKTLTCRFKATDGDVSDTIVYNA